MTNKRRLSIAIAGLFAAAIVLGTLVYFSRGGTTSNTRMQVMAPIESIDVLTLESFPPQYMVHIVSGLPSGCAQFEKAEVTGRTGSTLSIAVTNTIPAGKNVACTDIYGYHESNVGLGSDFTPAVTYTVDVNGTLATFTAQ